MSVDIANVTCSHLKMISVHTFNTVNKTDCRPVLSDLEYAPATKAGKAFLMNFNTKAGMLIDKISLASLFPQTLDIRPFKESPFSRTQPLTLESLTALNTKYNTVIGSEDSGVVDGYSSFDIESIQNFLTFCRVFGFYELNIEDVTLSTADGKLLIAVVDTNPTFVGYVEVLV